MIKRNWKAFLLGAASLTLAGTTGFLTATAVGQSGTPTRTVTINVASGQRGPAGPPGPKGEPGEQGPQGPAGKFSCIAGFSPGILVINTPGGQVRTYTCLEN